MHPALSRPTALILLTLLIKLGVIASLTSIIARFGSFKRLIFVEQRTPRQKLEFALFLGMPFMLGVLTRLLARYQGADLSLEITVLGGLLGGTIVGLVVGMMGSLPAVMIFSPRPWPYFMLSLRVRHAGFARIRKPSGSSVLSSISVSTARLNSGLSSPLLTGRSSLH